MRKQFELPEDDIEYLDSLGLEWETVIISGEHWLYIYKFIIPVGYNCKEATLAIRIGAYPQAKLDMAYFNPPLNRGDGKMINALTPLNIGGVMYQQWSRHYSWRDGLDSLVTHLSRISVWLTNELIKR